jgi:hypothetical protein
MSSSKAATARAAKPAGPAARPKATARRATKPAASKPATPVALASSPTGNGSDVQAEALRLAGTVEQALKDGKLDLLPPDALQALFASLCKLYSANVEQGAPYLPVGPRSGVTPTDVMVVASKLLRATNLQVFELGMWQSWTGR